MRCPLISFPLLFALSCGDPSTNQPAQSSIEASVDMPVIHSSDSSRKNLLQENSFDGKDYLNGFVTGQTCCEYSLRQEKGALRFEVRKDDPDISGSKRAEVTGKSYAEEERWYGFRVRLEDWIDDNAGEHIIQWHPNDSRGSANVALWTSGGIYTLVVSPDGQTNHYYEFNEKVVPNIPVDFVMHIRWSKTDSGLVEIWKDGKYIDKTANDKMLPYRGVTSTVGCYMKLGINKFGWTFEPSRTESTTTKRVLYYEEFREGNENATYEDVKPGRNRE